MKAEDIPRKGRTDPNLSDPRPEEFRNNEGYNDLVRNHIINYCACSETSNDIALRYAYPKADLQTAATDHLYETRPVTHFMVDRALQVFSIECFPIIIGF